MSCLRVYKIDQIERAKENGIPYATFTQRIRDGWKPSEAESVPLHVRRAKDVSVKQ